MAKVKDNSLQVKVKRLSPDAVIPKVQTEGSACFDLAAIEDTYIRNVNADGTRMVGTGLAFELPKGYHMEVYLRSSIGAKTPLRMANHVAIIDNDYRGEVRLLLENVSRVPYRIAKGERIAQAMIVKDLPVELVEVDELSDTKRGTNGIGSTGKE